LQGRDGASRKKAKEVNESDENLKRGEQVAGLNMRRDKEKKNQAGGGVKIKPYKGKTQEGREGKKTHSRAKGKKRKISKQVRTARKNQDERGADRKE